MSAELIAIATVVAVLVAGTLLLAYLTANRLDRLHVRTDLARLALVETLSRRHVVAAAVQRELTATDPAGAQRIAEALRRARVHPAGSVAVSDPTPDPDPRHRLSPLGPGNDPDAEHAENVLALELARLDRGAVSPAVLAELDDATERVEMARRFHNDAVRDTRALRERKLVRWFHIAGHAPMPDYVELVDTADTA